MPKTVRISLANKCQLLFGAAVVLILTAQLAVVWQRMQELVSHGPRRRARTVVDAYLGNMIQIDNVVSTDGPSIVSEGTDRVITVNLIPKEHFESAAKNVPFLAKAIRRFKKQSIRNELDERVVDDQGQQSYLFVRAIRELDQRHHRDVEVPGVDRTDLANPLEAILLIHLFPDLNERQQMMVNRIYMVAAGLLAGLLAIGAFWFITTRIILSPVRVLRDTAEKVTEGDLNIRSDINTGDEFEQLSETFNQMLETIKTHQDDLRRMNKSLDLKLGELAEHNVALYEADKIKGDFLANVSHELRTPLNSIIGFAEVLQETLRKRTGPVDEKRKRYINNIISSSRRLLDLINDLLDLAKIEAGRMGLRVGPMSIVDTAEGLMNLIRPQGEKRDIELVLQIDKNIPVVQTDASKVQQILFNFLSNAVKFTPEGGTITLSAGLFASADGQQKHVCISARDTGPGIARDDHERIFEKFTQLESSETRQHSGTGLGLTISRDLARLLQGRLEVDSDVGRGATFSLVIPLVLATPSAPLMPEPIDGHRASSL